MRWDMLFRLARDVISTKMPESIDNLLTTAAVMMDKEGVYYNVVQHYVLPASSDILDKTPF